MRTPNDNGMVQYYCRKSGGPAWTSATDRAIACADKAGTLRLVERPSRFGGLFATIEDDSGIIEAADNMRAATLRVDAALAGAAGKQPDPTAAALVSWAAAVTENLAGEDMDQFERECGVAS